MTPENTAASMQPKLETNLFIIWKKYQVFTPAAEVLLNEMKEHYAIFQ